MPGPLFDDRPEPDHHVPAFLREPPPAAPPPAPRPAPPDEQDSSGRRLAMRLPDWDLVPPTEFLDRRGRR